MVFEVGSHFVVTLHQEVSMQQKVNYIFSKSTLVHLSSFAYNTYTNVTQLMISNNEPQDVRRTDNKQMLLINQIQVNALSPAPQNRTTHHIEPNQANAIASQIDIISVLPIDTIIGCIQELLTHTQNGLLFFSFLFILHTWQLTCPFIGKIEKDNDKKKKRKERRFWRIWNDKRCRW